MKIAVIGGGNMGGAIAWGALANGIVEPCDIVVSHPRPLLTENIARSKFDVIFNNDNAQAIKGADMVVVAVKPWLVEGVMSEISATLDRATQLVVSVVAGLTFETMDEYLQTAQRGNVAMSRVIPNTAISVGQSATFICSQGTSNEQEMMLDELFSPLGTVYRVQPSEIRAVTALTSCGIAYMFKYIDAALNGAEQLGLERGAAREMLLQTVKGAVAMLEENGIEPQKEIDKVTTPGGITLRGLEAMERGGFSQAVVDGLLASK